ncbi:phosphopantothenoylcysteine decarboxylase/phosphopantothenate--cysteine ligase [Pseudomonas syringae pv. spinaceae]|uniref:Phosphopantothenoylcysteine decarboxylase/phosphopantothenate--cysteine ligase n=1 Tax=Pseudomonas syringae pv. spinaceae TaxID=264459 RepID=A0A0Q0CET3_PSESX|nr:phosphopantothenoylcysteine decarboxylase/phosphopantothenate--cysteine ligase [Pseudomonas syringae pv. spinaceae]
MRCIGRCVEFDFNALCTQLGARQGRQLRDPAAQNRVDDKAVVGVVRADGVKAHPRAFGIFVKARLPAIVGAIQRLEAYQRARRLAHGRCLSGRHARKACLGETAELAHAQAQSGLAGELDGSVPKTHVARDRQARTRLTQARRV